MTLNRACTIMTVKSVDEDKRVIVGIASAPSPDRDGDILEPGGAKFREEIPFLWQHDRSQPIGNCTPKMVKEGIQITAQLVKPTPDMPSQLAARLEEAWASIKSQLVKGLSVGFKPIKYAFLDSGGVHFQEWEMLETSAVTIPANADCSIQTVKSFDRQLLAALGNEKPVVKANQSAGATAQKQISQKGKPTMNIAEQIKSFENKRAALAASLSDIMSKAADEGRTLDVEETESYDNTSSEIKSVDEHLKRLRDMENNMAATAKPVTKAASGEVTVVNNAPSIIRVPPKLEKGIAMARFTKALAAAKGVRSEALSIAKSKYPEDTKLHHVLKAAVEAGTTTDPVWAGALVEYQDFANDFVDFLRPQTIIGQFGVGNIPSLREVPFNVRIPVQTSGGAAQWVGQGKAKPLTKFDFSNITFGFSKVAAISVLTEELIRFSNPKADILVRNSLAESVIARLDTDFVDPAKTEVAGISPASITNGATTIPSTGDPDADSTAAFDVFINANLQPTGAVWLMSSSTALAISKRKNALGQKEYPDMTMFGGTFEGLPAIVSQYVGNQLILMNAPDVYLADEGGVAVDMSTEASLEMESEPTGDSITPVAVELVSMWQTNSVAIRAERWINWKRRRTAAVAVISGVNYSSGQTS
ncbi:phage major capsid protein [Entomohabitans teleogrylli]|uniref:phage major capsid protein n=1 Tax=Entomohabitans teleogrylli TaxID=1384589 RepID=UPI00073DA89C|nr:phage major capsid protein [Entomohabitans teleogrylli]